jgi:hypothetical protein
VVELYIVNHFLFINNSGLSLYGEDIAGATTIWETSYEHESSVDDTYTSRTLYEHCKNSKLPSGGFLVDNDYKGNSENGLRWFTYGKNSIEDKGLLVCEEYPGFRPLNGAAYDLSRRYSVLATCSEIYLREGKGPSFLKYILDVETNHSNLFQSALDAVKVFWQCDIDINNYMNGNPQSALLNNLDSLSKDRYYGSAISESALAMVSMLYCLVSSFSRVRLLQSDDLEAIIEGCLLSPLFADQAFCSNPIMDSSVKDMDKKLRSYHNNFDKALNKSKESLSLGDKNTVVGTRRQVRWVEVIKIILEKVILQLVPSNESNLYTHWFDGFGILIAIRLNSIPSKKSRHIKSGPYEGHYYDHNQELLQVYEFVFIYLYVYIHVCIYVDIIIYGYLNTDAGAYVRIFKCISFLDRYESAPSSR